MVSISEYFDESRCKYVSKAIYKANIQKGSPDPELLAGLSRSVEVASSWPQNIYFHAYPSDFIKLVAQHNGG